MSFYSQTPHQSFQRTKISAAVLLGLLSISLSAHSFAAEDSTPSTQASAPASDNSAITSPPQPDAVAAEPTPDSVVITARNRQEKAQSVPVPATVVGSKQLDRDGTVNIQQLTEDAPDLSATTPNARRTGISIRGIGKSSSNDNMEASVGVIVDDVYLSHVGMTFQDFTDLDHIEVLRGPQGTLLGKNTSIGALDFVSKLPSFSPHGSFDVGTGLNTQGLQLSASRTDALIDDVLAYRASVFVDQQQGDLKDISPVGGYQQEKNRYGGRLQFLWKPTDDLNVRLNLDEAQSSELGNTKPWMEDPTDFADGVSRTANNGLTFSSRLARSYFDGYTPQIGSSSWNQIDVAQAKPLQTKNSGESLNIDWDLGAVTLKSITAARKLYFSAWNDNDQTKFDINDGGTLVNHEQFSQEFRLTSKVGGPFDYQAGLYFLHDSTESTSRSLYGQDAGAFYATNSQYSTLSALATGKALLQSSLNNVYSTTLITPRTDSIAAYSQANWHITDKATLTVGLRDTEEKNSADSLKEATYYDGSALVSTGNATADAIRASQLGTVYGLAHGQDIDNNSISWLVNPSYKLTEDVLLFASASAGEKSGSVQFNSKGGDLNVAPERSLDFELGVKSLLLDRSLLLNVNLFDTQVKDYQATTSIIDPTSSTGYSSVLGNIPGILARGIEAEGSYIANQKLNMNFSLTFNDAVYSDWATATCPAEVVNQVVCNNTGKQIVGAPKYTAAIGPDFHQALGYDGLVFHTYLNAVYRSSQNLESQLSIYGRQAAYTIFDGGIGIGGTHNKDKWELDLSGRNLTNTKYTTSVTNFSNSAPVGYDGIGARRYISLTLKTSY